MSTGGSEVPCSPPPDCHEIQRLLVANGDKPNSFLESKEWIGSIEVGLCVDIIYDVGRIFFSIMTHTLTRKHFFKIFEFASRLPEEMFPWYYMHSDMFNISNSRVKWTLTMLLYYLFILYCKYLCREHGTMVSAVGHEECVSQRRGFNSQSWYSYIISCLYYHVSKLIKLRIIQSYLKF